MSSLNNPQSPTNGRNHNIQLPTFPPSPPPSPIHQQIPSRPSQCYPNPPLPHPPTHTCNAIKRNSNNVALRRPPDRDEIPVSRPTMQCDAMRCDPIQSVQRTLSKDPVEVRAGTLWKTSSSACYVASVGRSYSIYTCADGCWLAGWLVVMIRRKKTNGSRGGNPPNVKNDVATLPIATSRTC